MLATTVVPAHKLADAFLSSLLDFQVDNRATSDRRSKRADGTCTRERRILLDVSETESSVRVRADVPGVSKADIKASIADSVLSIEVSPEQCGEGKLDEVMWHRRERRCHYKNRSIKLPETADTAAPKTTLVDGVLCVTFPKKQPTPKPIHLSIS